MAIFYGDGAPVAVPFWKKLNPAPPTHYTYDYINADVLQHHATGGNGELVLDSGMRYRLLVIPDDTTEISLPTLRALETLVRNGACCSAPDRKWAPVWIEARSKTAKLQPLPIRCGAPMPRPRQAMPSAKAAFTQAVLLKPCSQASTFSQTHLERGSQRRPQHRLRHSQGLDR